MRFPRGESLQHVGARVADALRFLLERHSGETVVLVGHDSSNRVMLLELLELPLSAYWRIDQDPCGVSEILVNTKHAKVLFLNETQHLKTGRFDALLRNP
jgi:probable phosphoglycerate mutase